MHKTNSNYVPVVKTQLVSELAEICPSAEQMLTTMQMFQK